MESRMKMMPRKMNVKRDVAPITVSPHAFFWQQQGMQPPIAPTMFDRKRAKQQQQLLLHALQGSTFLAREAFFNQLAMGHRGASETSESQLMLRATHILQTDHVYELMRSIAQQLYWQMLVAQVYNLKWCGDAIDEYTRATGGKGVCSLSAREN